MGEVDEVPIRNFSPKNINYNYLTDFNGDGEFHAVLSAQWEEEHSADPTFATGIGTATFDSDSDMKLRDKFRDGTFNPFSTEISDEAFTDRLKYVIYVLGRYFLLHGRNEIAYCVLGVK
jgi:hypothetical protein